MSTFNLLAASAVDFPNTYNKLRCRAVTFNCECYKMANE